MTEARKVPKGYHSIQPYLMFTSCTEAMDFYGKVFSAKERLHMKNEDGRTVHAELEVGDSVFMIADENSEIGAFAPTHYGGSPISLMLYVSDCDTTYNLALACGATSLRVPTDQPYGDRMAGVLDPFGYKWWIAHSLGNQDEVAQ